MQQTETEVAALASFLKENLDPQLFELERGTSERTHVLLAPKGYDVHKIKHYLDEYLEAPERLKGCAVLTDLASFVAHVTRFKDEHSALFASANPSSSHLQCVFDYSQSADEPRFGEHRALYKFPLSEEWQAWMAMDEKPFAKQELFAQFIEDRIADIGDPDESGKEAIDFAELIHAQYASPSKLLQLSTGIEVHAHMKASKKVNLGSGETQIQFVEEHDARDHEGPMKVPGAFLLNIPIFEGDEERVMLPVRLRYRLNKESGEVHWSFSVYRADKAFDATLRERADSAARDLKLPLFYGAPEAK